MNLREYKNENFRLREAINMHAKTRAGLLKRIDELKSKNAELNKYLKHARDDKEIRVKEIEVLEAKIVELRGLLKGGDDVE